MESSEDDEVLQLTKMIDVSVATTQMPPHDRIVPACPCPCPCPCPCARHNNHVSPLTRSMPKNAYGRNNSVVRLQDFFSMLTPGSRGAGAGVSGARSSAATGPHATVARELLDLIEFSIAALRRQASLKARPRCP